jgi:hypothetical protein
MGSTMGSFLGSLVAATAVLLAAAPSSYAGAGQPQVPAPPGPEGAASQLVALKAQLMAADYRGNLAELGRLREAASRLTGDPELGYLAHYWAGFASWRIAINGASADMGPGDLKAHLQRAVEDFAAAARLREGFADAYAAGSLARGWLGRFFPSDPAAARQHFDVAMQLSARAKALAPTNPRVLWMQGAEYLYLPPSLGGNTQRAIEVYRQMAAASDAAAPPGSPLPDWGKPEALMSLAYAHLNQNPPDLAAASAEAHEALRLVPEWHYVRDILLPMIEARRKPSQ